MLRVALGFMVLALVAVLLGKSGLAGFSVKTGGTLLVVIVVAAVISFLVMRFSERGPKSPL